METSYGLRGKITPMEVLMDHKELFHDGPFQISIENNILEIGYEDMSLIDQARDKANRYIDVLSFDLRRKLTIDLDSSWSKNSNGGRSVCISLACGAFIVSPSESKSLAQRSEMVKKCDKDLALTSALHYFNEEVINSDKPLYGIYKAIEALTKALGKKHGREKLGRLIGKSERYVDDIMQTAQLTRHHNDQNANLILTEAECKERARKLIEAYMNLVN